MNILIATVGTGRNREDIADAILRSVTDNRVQAVYLLCSTKTKEETYPLIVNAIAKYDEGIDIFSDVLPEGHEDHFDQAFERWYKKWNEWKLDSANDAVIVDFTSGTKPMTAAASMLGIFKEAHKLSYVFGKRDTTGRAEKSEGTYPIYPKKIYSYMKIRKAAQLFNNGDYSGAIDLAKEYRKPDIELPMELLEASRFIASFGAVYLHWERFAWDKAHQKLHEIREIPESIQLTSNLNLSGIKSHIKFLKDNKITPTLVLAVDLLENARRCIARGKFDDAVCRLYRTTELISQLALFERYGINTKNLSPADLTSLSEEERSTFRTDWKGRASLGLRESYRLIKLLRSGSPLAEKFDALYYRNGEGNGPLSNLLNERNDSLMAHGFKPIKPEKAQALYDIVEQLLNAYSEESHQKKTIEKIREICNFAKLKSI